MRYHLKNRASHWEGDTLVLAWCVVDQHGVKLSEYGGARAAIAYLTFLNRQQKAAA